MSNLRSISVPISVLLILIGSFSVTIASENLYPVIGIVTLPVNSWANLDPTEYSYIVSSYVAFVQGAGARAAIIPWQASNLSDYVLAVNGIYFTGGSQNLSYPNNGSLTPYGEVLNTILNIVIEENKNRYFPLWGTCQGIEALGILLSRNGSILGPCVGFCIYVNGFNYFLGKRGRMFKDLPSDLVLKMGYKNLTVFDHNLQIDYLAYQQNDLLNSQVDALLYSFDGTGTAFVSAMEHKTLPIYATQFHPEKSTYEWEHKKIGHDYDAIRIEQHLSNFFAQETRKSNYTFNETAHGWFLIFNYQFEYIPASKYSSVYVFKNSDF